MRLHRFEYSCYARFVQAAFELAGVPVELVDVPFGNRNELATLTGGYIQVPVVQTDDGTVLTDSRRIVETLVRDDARFASLVPAKEAAAVWAYVDWAQNILEDVAFRIASPMLRYRQKSAWERALFVFVKERKFGTGCVDAWKRDMDNLVARLVDLLAPTVATLSERPFVLGGSPTLADAALYGQIVMLEFGAPDRVATLAPALHAWKRRLEERMGPPPYGRPAREHRAVEAIEAAMARTSGAPRAGTLDLIVVRPEMHVREVPSSIELAPGRGLAGDAWKPHDTHGTDMEVSLIDVRVAAAVAAREDWPLFGDNLYVDFGIGEDALQPGDRIAIGDAVLEITPYPHLGCRKLMARFGADALKWINAKPHRAERRRGIYARIISGATVRVGDRIRRA
jgi:glutathione S-transferase